MLEPLVRHSGLDAHLDGMLSVDAAGIYKPSPRVYQLAVDRLRLPASRIGVRVVERLGRDRREGVRLHDVLDQPRRRARRPARAAAGSDPCDRSPSCPRWLAHDSRHVLPAVDLDHLPVT